MESLIYPLYMYKIAGHSSHCTLDTHHEYTHIPSFQWLELYAWLCIPTKWSNIMITIFNMYCSVYKAMEYWPLVDMLLSLHNEMVQSTKSNCCGTDPRKSKSSTCGKAFWSKWQLKCSVLHQWHHCTACAAMCSSGQSTGFSKIMPGHTQLVL